MIFICELNSLIYANYICIHGAKKRKKGEREKQLFGNIYNISKNLYLQTSFIILQIRKAFYILLSVYLFFYIIFIKYYKLLYTAGRDCVNFFLS